MSVIEAVNLEMRYKNQSESALKPVTFSVGQGEILGIIGHNGSGKSTLLKILATILIQTSGGRQHPNQVYAGGRDLKMGHGPFEPDKNPLPGRSCNHIYKAFAGGHPYHPQ